MAEVRRPFPATDANRPLPSAAPRPLVVLHCRSSSGRHGPERALLELAPALAERGVELRLLALYRQPPSGPALHPWIAEARAMGIEADQILDSRPLSLGVVRRLTTKLRQDNVHILHTHDYKTNILGGLAARQAMPSLPWVATVHLHTVTTARLRLYRALDLFLLRLADRVISVSRNQRRLLLEHGVDRHRIALIPNAIDARAFAAGAGIPDATRLQWALPQGAPVVTLVGRLSAQKGVDDFLRAARLVQSSRPQTQFVIVGDGPRRKELEAQAEALGLDGAVRFLGFQADVAPILAASDLVVLPSRAEGLPVVLLEAMALARPVVATRVGGVPELIHHGETGYLVRPDAPDQVAASILAMLADPDKATRLGAAAQAFVAQHFTPDLAARRLAAVYRTVLHEHVAG